VKTTLLITSFNRGHLLKNSLERLTNLTLPDEVLVVDDGSVDNTGETVKEFEARLPVRYIFNNNPDWSICSMARNIGVKQAIGDIIITSEPELLWVTDVVKQMLASRENHPNEIISAGIIYHAQGGAVFNPGFYTDPASALKSEIVEDYQTQPRSYHFNGYCKTKNMQATFAALYEKSWIEMVGGWDESFPGPWGWDDVDLCTRLRIKGINQHICPEIEAIHQWHPHLPPHIQGPGAQKNEFHMIAKKLGDENPNNPNLIANQGKEWGVIK
jgi:GT2 family glycosyltransferase